MIHFARNLDFHEGDSSRRNEQVNEYLDLRPTNSCRSLVDFLVSVWQLWAQDGSGWVGVRGGQRASGGNPPLVPLIGAAAPVTARKRASRSRAQAVVCDRFSSPRTLSAHQFPPRLATRLPSIGAVSNCCIAYGCALPARMPSWRRLMRSSHMMSLFVSFGSSFWQLLHSLASPISLFIRECFVLLKVSQTMHPGTILRARN